MNNITIYVGRLHTESMSVDHALARVTVTARAVSQAQEAHQEAIIEARRGGASIRELAEAADCPPSRVYDLVRRRQRALSIEDGQARNRGASAEDVVVVAGGPYGAYGIYRRFAVYACQPHRFFRPTARYVGFYYAKRIYPEFGAILHVATSVRFDEESLAEMLRSSNAFDVQIAHIATALCAEGLRDAHTRNQIVLLSPVNDARTLTLPHAIHHPGDAAWTRNQRYMSSAALRLGVTSTLEFERTHMIQSSSIGTRRIAPDLRLVAFKINRLYRDGMIGAQLYEITRQAWKMDPYRHNPDYAFAVANGVVRAVYRINDWEPTSGNRWRFNGELDTELTQRYSGVDVSDEIGRATNPVRYINC